MHLISVLAFIGAVASATLSVPQFLLVVRTKDTRGLSLSTWVISLGTGVGWLCHGLRIDQINLVWPNFWGLTVAGTVLYFLWRNGRYKSPLTLLPGLCLGATLVTLDHVLGSAAFGLAIMVPGAYGMVRQGVALMRAPRVTGVSTTTWVIQTANQSLWLVWAGLVREPGTFISSAVCLCAAVFTLTWRVLRARGVGPVGRHAQTAPGLALSAAAGSGTTA